VKLDGSDLLGLAERASEAARAAGAHISASRPSDIQHKPGGTSPASRIVTEIDRSAQQIILDVLEPTRARFDLAVLSEEAADDGRRLTADHFWCIDPLDGTLPFAEGTDGFAVSIALLSRDGVPRLGVVFDPIRNRLYRAVYDHGLTVDGRPFTMPSAPRSSLSVFLDRSAREQPGYQSLVDAVADDLGREVAIQTGPGAVINACRVLDNPLACYIKLPKSSEGGGSLWDFAATACMFREAGAVATDIHGAALDLNRPDSTFMNHHGVLFASNSSLAARVRALYRANADAA